ncbi:MAG: YARHG domain-containing protein [Ignavibacteria bacterium]|nr:YARHG domain-containing protein [Ignavibacteria bacterium]
MKFHCLFLLILFNSFCLSQSEFNVRLYDKSKIYSQQEIEKLFPFERELIKAEILANYGYKFQDTLLQKHFDKQIWYKARTDTMPNLNETDATNYFNFSLASLNIKNTVKENLTRYKIDLTNTIRVYFTYCFENSDYKSIAKKRFKLIPFNFRYAQFFFKPRLEVSLPPADFERFLDAEKFNIKDYIFFKKANDVRGILYRADFTPNGMPLLISEVGIEPGFDIGAIYSRSYLDSLGRVSAFHRMSCNDADVKEMAKIYFYDDKEITKEILMLEDNHNLYLQVTTKDYFIETGLKKKIDENE